MNLRNLSPALLALTLFSVGCGGEDSHEDDSTPDAEVAAILALSGDITAGAAVFSNTCAACHGADGDSGYAGDLTDEIPNHSDQAIVDIIINGDGSMPAQTSLSDQDVADALAYCRDTFGS